MVAKGLSRLPVFHSSDRHFRALLSLDAQFVVAVQGVGGLFSNKCSQFLVSCTEDLHLCALLA